MGFQNATGARGMMVAGRANSAAPVAIAACCLTIILALGGRWRPGRVGRASCGADVAVVGRHCARIAPFPCDRMACTAIFSILADIDDADLPISSRHRACGNRPFFFAGNRDDDCRGRGVSNWNCAVREAQSGSARVESGIAIRRGHGVSVCLLSPKPAACHRASLRLHGQHGKTPLFAHSEVFISA
jgi:hypothetical protein